MKPIGQVKKELIYSQNLKDVIDILKLIASSEFARLSSMVPEEDLLREYIIKCFSMMGGVASNNPFLSQKKGLPKAYLLMCSDEGFLGESNNHIVNAALSRGARRSAKYIVMGERGEKLLEDAGVSSTVIPVLKGDITMNKVQGLTNNIFTLFKGGKIGSFHVVYMKFKTFTSHSVETEKLLPCDDLIPFLKTSAAALETIIEPDPYHVAEYLVRLWLENNIFNVFWSSKLSEWSTRVMHLEGSSEELKNMTESLKFKYFKSVHALNDKVIREIFAARTATGDLR